MATLPLDKVNHHGFLKFSFLTTVGCTHRTNNIIVDLHESYLTKIFIVDLHELYLTKIFIADLHRSYHNPNRLACPCQQTNRVNTPTPRILEDFLLVDKFCWQEHANRLKLHNERCKSAIKIFFKRQLAQNYNKNRQRICTDHNNFSNFLDG